MPKNYIYIGGFTEAMKVEFPHLIRRGVPFKVEDIFDDLFANDPIYIEVTDDHAAAIQASLDKTAGDAGALDMAKAVILEDLAQAIRDKDARVTAARIASQKEG